MSVRHVGAPCRWRSSADAREGYESGIPVSYCPMIRWQCATSWFPAALAMASLWAQTLLSSSLAVVKNKNGWMSDETKPLQKGVPPWGSAGAYRLAVLLWLCAHVPVVAADGVGC